MSLKECFMELFHIAYGLIFGFVLGLSVIKTYVNTCTMLRVKNVKVNKQIKDKLMIETSLFPVLLRSSVLYVSEVHLFIHTNFSKDHQRPYSKNNFGVLYYEVVSSPFLLFKSYLDIIDRVIFNLCDKNL